MAVNSSTDGARLVMENNELNEAKRRQDIANWGKTMAAPGLKPWIPVDLDPPSTALQVTAGATHYTQGDIQVIDVLERWNLNRNMANVVKYALRCEHKGNKNLDLEKLIDYAWRERYGTWAPQSERSKK